MTCADSSTSSPPAVDPAALTDDPAVLTDHPAALTDDPAVLTDDPAALTDDPAAHCPLTPKSLNRSEARAV
jgi:hypothetical protein